MIWFHRISKLHFLTQFGCWFSSDPEHPPEFWSQLDLSRQNHQFTEGSVHQLQWRSNTGNFPMCLVWRCLACLVLQFTCSLKVNMFACFLSWLQCPRIPRAEEFTLINVHLRFCCCFWWDYSSSCSTTVSKRHAALLLRSQHAQNPWKSASCQHDTCTKRCLWLCKHPIYNHHKYYRNLQDILIETSRCKQFLGSHCWTTPHGKATDCTAHWSRHRHPRAKAATLGTAVALSMQFDSGSLDNFFRPHYFPFMWDMKWNEVSVLPVEA